MNKSLLTIPLTALAIAGCGSAYGSDSAPTPAARPAHSPAAAVAGVDTPAAPALKLAHGKLGTYLTDSRGRALYLFEADKGSTSVCYSACASVWPPLTVTGHVTPGAGLSRGLLGTTKRHDGTTEVTYGGHPLYYYAGDTAPGSLTGQSLNQFGAGWYVVAANGKKIDTDDH